MLIENPELAFELRQYYLSSLDGYNLMCFGSEHPIELLDEEAAIFIRLERELLKEQQPFDTIVKCRESSFNYYEITYATETEKVYPEFAEAKTQEILGYSNKKLECINAYLTNYCNYMWFYE